MNPRRRCNRLPCREEQPAAPAAPVPVAAAPPPVDQSAEEARKRLAQLREQAIQSAMEVPLGLDGFGGGLMKVAETLPAPAPASRKTIRASACSMRCSRPSRRPASGQGRAIRTARPTRRRMWRNSSRSKPPPAITGPQPPINPYVVRTGTVIPMVMITGINSDLPGMVTAQVSQDVFDTPAGRWVLIPQGTRLVGQYDSNVTYGQNRVLVVWNRLIYPDGGAVEIGGMPGADQAGYAGLADKVDNHYLRIFGSALLLSFISAGYEVATNTDQNTQTTSDTAREAVARQMSQVGSEMLRKNLNIQPTIIIRPGQVGTIMVNKDMYLKPWRGQYADSHKASW